MKLYKHSSTPSILISAPKIWQSELTLKVLILTGIKFHEFCEFGPNSQNYVPVKYWFHAVKFSQFFFLQLILYVWSLVRIIWDKLFKIGSSNICGRQPLKNLKGYGLLKQTISLQIFQRLSSTNFTWSILEQFVPYRPVNIFFHSYGRPMNALK